MEVTVRLFAQLRERAGASELTIELADDARVQDAIDELGHVTAGMPVVMAVNREYVKEDAALSPGDELALIPPVSGGATTVTAQETVTGTFLALDARTVTAATAAPETQETVTGTFLAWAQKR